jgi:hypothetical protein
MDLFGTKSGPACDWCGGETRLISSTSRGSLYIVSVGHCPCCNRTTEARVFIGEGDDGRLQLREEWPVARRRLWFDCL